MLLQLGTTILMPAAQKLVLEDCPDSKKWQVQVLGAFPPFVKHLTGTPGTPSAPSEHVVLGQRTCPEHAAQHASVSQRILLPPPAQPETRTVSICFDLLPFCFSVDIISPVLISPGSKVFLRAYHRRRTRHAV